MEAVNLLPAYARPGHPWASVGKDVSPRRVFTAAGAAAGAVVLLLGLGYVYEHSVVSQRRAALAEVEAKVATADAKAAPLRAAQAAVAARIAGAGTVAKNRVVWEQLLADVSRVLPSQVYLQSLSLQSPTPFSTGGTAYASSAAGALGFTATGVATSHVRVALVLDRFEGVPWLSNLMLVSSTNGRSGASGTSATLANGDTFTVSAAFDPTGGSK